MAAKREFRIKVRRKCITHETGWLTVEAADAAEAVELAEALPEPPMETSDHEVCDTSYAVEG